MPVRRSVKSLKQLSLDYVTQHLSDYYERYKHSIDRLDFVGPFDILRKYKNVLPAYFMFKVIHVSCTVYSLKFVGRNQQ